MDYADYSVTLRNESNSDLLLTFVSSKKKCDTLKMNNEEGVEPCYFCSWSQYFDSNEVFLLRISYLDSSKKDSVFVLKKDILDSIDKDRKSTRLNSSHVRISYAVFCLKKKTADIILCRFSIYTC